jgi:modulator of FtsH protease
MSGWESFYVAQVGASAAAAGLVFVGVSINLNKILKYPSLPGRALEALVVLMLVLVASSLTLVPGQSNVAIGAELLVVGIVG